jgi:WS/DGAT/MGAT family acyltransferase
VTVRVDRLTADDELMLSASATWPQDIVAVAMLEASGLLSPDGFELGRVREAIERRIHLVPRLRQVIRFPGRWQGPPYWVDDASFDLAAHVGHRVVRAPGSESELLTAVEELRREPLDSSRPMWAMWFLTGLQDGRVAWVVKLNHAMTDGLAAMTTVRSLLDASGSGTRTPMPWNPRREPTPRELVTDAMRARVGSIARMLAGAARPRATWRTWRLAWPAVRELVGERPASRTSVDAVIGRDRVLARISVPTATVRHVAREHDTSVNDVLLALTEAGLRELLRHRGERTDGRFLRAYVPVTLRRRLGGAQHGNQVSQMVVPLLLDEAEAGARLRRLARETARRKARTRIALGALFGGRLARGLLLKAVIRQRVNVTTASVPGGARHRSLAGAELREVTPILPLIGNVPLGVGAVAYGDTLGIGITADRATYPDLDVLVAAMRAELAALEATVRPQPGRGVARLGTSWSSQTLPSGSANVAYEP